MFSKLQNIFHVGTNLHQFLVWHLHDSKQSKTTANTRWIQFSFPQPCDCANIGSLARWCHSWFIFLWNIVTHQPMCGVIYVLEFKNVCHRIL